MRNTWKQFFRLVGFLGLLGLLTGCQNAQRKLGRGISNTFEPVRMGELRRSLEQTTLWEGADVGKSYGLVHGLTRTISRTAVGAFEIATFPIPTQPIIKPERPVFPDGFRPKPTATSSMETDNYIGFDTSGDVFPWSPGSRFHIFD